jgi:serine/threonine protein kinase
MKEEEITFRKEAEMLKRFNGIFHEHLVTLLMTWSKFNTHYFLFPWAGCNLDQYWMKQTNDWSLGAQNQLLNRGTMRWISKQILGLTQALRLIHNPPHLAENPKFGRHGDLKPENILWYKSGLDPMGILVIADFGLAALNSDQSRSNIPGENLPRTPNYRPPECDMDGGKVSRSFDIWTFGCFLLEWTCWALGGKELRERFATERTTRYITGASTNIFFDVQKLETVTSEGGAYVVMRKQKVSEVYRVLYTMLLNCY